MAGEWLCTFQETCRQNKKVFFSVHLSRSIDLFLDQLIYSRSIKKCARPDVKTQNIDFYLVTGLMESKFPVHVESHLK